MNIKKLSLAIPGSEPPTEFRIFTSGEVVTTKGTFVFDDEAAAAVVAEYVAHGVDLPIDYDHASLSTDRAPDPAHAGKAAGWFNIEVRNGELWAVNVRWTDPAADALRRKEWRFVSPAFQTKGNRITALCNVAITNLPATRRLSPLMAASTGAMKMEISLVQEALDALIAEDAGKCQDILKSIIASAASGEPADVAPPAPIEEDVPVDVAASTRLMRLTGRTSLAGAADEVQVLARERQQLALELAGYEQAERRYLCSKLIKEAGRAPATVWADDAAQTVKPYLRALTITELRQHVDDEIRSLGGKPHPRYTRLQPPGSTGALPDGGAEFTTPNGVIKLSARELAVCDEMKVDPAKYAANKAVTP